MNDEAITIHLDTARGHITRATLPDNQAGNRKLCWHLAGISLSAAMKICERKGVGWDSFQNVSQPKPIENNNMKIRATVTALVLATVSGVFGSTFTGLPDGETWNEFVKKMDQSPTALAAYSNRIIAATSSGTLPSGTVLTNPVIADGLSATGSAGYDFSGSTGSFYTSSGSNVFQGYVTVSATTPGIETATGQTNSGFLLTRGKTSGGLKFLPADASGFIVTLTNSTQTVGNASITIPNFAGVSDVPVYQTLAQTLASKTLTAPVIATGLTASGSASNDFSGSTGTFKTSSGATTISGAEVRSTDALSGAGAVSVTKCVTKLTTTGSAQALTLADGVDGQVKTIVHDVDGGSAVLTPATKTGFTIITFTNVGESATLVFVTTRGWILISIVGAVAS